MKYNSKIIGVMVCLCVMFLSLAGYLTYFTLFEAEDVTKNVYNKRIREREERILRGSVFDCNGEVLAYSKITDEGHQERVYPFLGRYAHVVGYNSVKYGKTGLESSFNDQLLDTNELDSLSNIITGSDEMNKGADLYLTIDNNLTSRAESMMKGRNGAVVAIVPKTGAVLCMYSNPTFNPSEEYLDDNFARLSQKEDSPFLGRAAQGLYPPGSTFKVVTAAAAIEEEKANEVEDNGSMVIDGYEIKNYETKSYGKISAKEGFAYSSNVMFALYGVTVGEKSLKKTAESFGIGEKMPFDVVTSKSMMNYENEMTLTDLAACGIGQGKLLVTPMNMALVAAAIANDGVMMEPYIVEKAAYDGKGSIYSHETKVWKKAVSKTVADIIEEYMIECVNTGTGKAVKIDNVSVAAKTGTAENEIEGKEHAWFICYAPCENPEIAICVMQEYTGKTGSSCAPIAKDLIMYYLNK